MTHLNRDGQGGLAMRREDIKAGVFRPGHILPTMTLDELADIEIAAAIEVRSRSKQ